MFLCTLYLVPVGLMAIMAWPRLRWLLRRPASPDRFWRLVGLAFVVFFWFIALALMLFPSAPKDSREHP